MKKLLVALALTTTYPAFARGFTPQDMVSLDRISEAAVSADGRVAAFTMRETDLAANKGRTDIFTLDLTRAGAKPVRFQGSPAANEHIAAFSPDGTTLYFLSDRGGTGQVWAAPIAGGPARAVTALPVEVSGFKLAPTGTALAIWAEAPSDCPTIACAATRAAAKPAGGSGRTYDQLFVRHWDTWAGPTRSRLYTVPIGPAPATDATLVSAGLVGDVPSKPNGDGSEISWSADGKTLYFALREAGRTEAWSTNLDIFSTAASGATPPVNLTSANLATDTLPAASPDGKTLAWVAMARPTFEADRQVLWLRDIASGKTRALTQGWDRSVSSIAWSPDSRTLYVTAENIGQNPVFAIDANSGKVTPFNTEGSVDAVLPVGNAVFVTMASLTGPSDLYRLGAHGVMGRFTNINADKLSGVEMSKPEQFSFTGAKGDKVYGYVLPPIGRPAGEKAPVAFLIHGGPQGSFGNSWSFRWNPQAWAGAGYAVVMIDFHGSTGYGQKFTDAISQDWGGAPLEDLQKGLAAAAAKYPFVDSSRACALGGSYGGYMVNWIAGNWPGGFKCLVSHAGVFDARGMAYGTEELWFDEWEHGGTYYDKPENYERANPVNYVKNWKTPILIFHGEKDFRIPYVQGLSAFTAAQRRGVPSRLVVYPDENHWILKPANSLQWYGEVFAWMDKWLKPDAAK